MRKVLTSIQIAMYATNDENFCWIIAGMFRNNMIEHSSLTTTNYGLSPYIFATDSRDTKYRERREDRERWAFQVQPFASNAFGIRCGMYPVSIRLQSNFNSSEIRVLDKHKGKSFPYNSTTFSAIYVRIYMGMDSTVAANFHSNSQNRTFIIRFY